MKRNLLAFLTRYGVILFFVLYALIGLISFADYGCGPDEGMERQTSLVNFKYVIEKLSLPVPEATTRWLAYLPDLTEYRDRYYGTALHFPLVLIEAFANFQFEPAVFYGMRHLFTFLNFYLGVICFYLLLKKRLGNRGWALLGAAMLVLSPRFFAESFYNNKDVLFLSWYLISCWLLVRWFENKTWKNAALAGVALALTCNTRLNAIIFFPLAAGFFLIDFLRGRSRSKRDFLSLAVLLLTAVAVFYLITPNFWEAPLRTALETFAFNRAHPNHGSDGNLFLGRLVDSTQMWYFVPLWILLTTPVLYLVLSGIGLTASAMRGLHSLRSLRGRILMNTGRLDNAGLMDLFLFCVGFLPPLIIIGMRVTIYNGWRHCYFAYGTILYFAVLGGDAIFRLKIPNRFWRSVRTVGLAGAIGLSFAVTLAWMIANHPYQYVYFNAFVREYAGHFSGDYWGIASRDLLRFVVETDERPLIVIDHSYTQTGSINRGLLDAVDRDRIDLVYDPDAADYILYGRDDKPGGAVEFAGFEPVFSIRVDADEIGIVFRRLDQRPQ